MMWMLPEVHELSLAAKDMDIMTRVTPFASPLLLGFDAMEKTLERLSKINDGYPPYNIERLRADKVTGEPDRLRITLAVAGFAEDDLDVTTEENQLTIRGRQAAEPGEREYLHRGIASRTIPALLHACRRHGGDSGCAQERFALN